MRSTAIVLVTLASLATAACLRNETISTLYLHEDGHVEWVVIEHDVHSDETDLVKQGREERDYLDRIARFEHPVAAAFLALGSRHVQTGLLRASRPYASIVEARFDSLSAVFEPALSACQVPYTIDVADKGTSTTWTLRAFVDLDKDYGDYGARAADANADCPNLDALSDAIGSLRLVPERGRFTGASGFTLNGHDARPDFDAIEQMHKDQAGHIVLSLTWTR